MILPAVFPLAWNESAPPTVNSPVDSETVMAPFALGLAAGLALTLTFGPNVVAPTVFRVTVVPAEINGEFNVLEPVPVSFSISAPVVAIMLPLNCAVPPDPINVFSVTELPETGPEKVTAVADGEANVRAPPVLNELTVTAALRVSLIFIGPETELAVMLAVLTLRGADVPMLPAALVITTVAPVMVVLAAVMFPAPEINCTAELLLPSVAPLNVIPPAPLLVSITIDVAPGSVGVNVTAAADCSENVLVEFALVTERAATPVPGLKPRLSRKVSPAVLAARDVVSTLSGVAAIPMLPFLSVTVLD